MASSTMPSNASPLYDPCSSSFSTQHTQASIKPYVTMNKSAADIIKETPIPPVIHHPIPLTDFQCFQAAIYTNIGGRKFQEDRFVMCPKLIPNRSDASLFGVFDGTVGDFASDTVKDLVVPHLIASPAWKEIVEKLSTKGEYEHLSEEFEKELKGLLEEAIDYMYKNADAELLHLCKIKELHYTSSTSIIVVLLHNLIGVGHLGDSRIAIGREIDGRMCAEFMTTDHKPDQDVERARIERSGGSVEYLHNHNDKPFIRGGDFTARKQKGEQPMQLQYSRAFGGKDLKMYGLSNQPDIKIINLDSSVKVMILASDGLWDVQPAANAVDICTKCRQSENPAKTLVHVTLDEQMARNQSADNITAMTIFF